MGFDDRLEAQRDTSLVSPFGFIGELTLERFDAGGDLAERIVVPNLITEVGDQAIMERYAAVGGAPAIGTGMKLGIGVGIATKTGAGSALGSYHAASNLVFTTGPISSLVGSARQILWTCAWVVPGVISGVALSEAVIVNDAAVNATSTSPNTYSRSLFGPMLLGVADTLTATWKWLGEGT